ncbi:MAG: AAA family ATPase [Candidatus Omnitrophica bacterium]|nr:AAA family ATPase [Candidatus Omnitrophota bacterium]
MGYTIAIAGKGGIGKSTIASLIIRMLKEKKLGSVLGVDADPNSNLGEFLGIKPGRSIGEVLDEISAHKDKIPAGMTKDRYIEYEVQTVIEEGEGVDILAMGRPEGPGCYCYVNNILRNIVGKLIKDYDFVVIDNEAGLEHLSRKTTSSADVLLVVSDPSPAGLRAAKRISDLTLELKIKTKKRFLLINRSAKELDKDKLEGIQLDYLGMIPEDAGIGKLSVAGEPLWELAKGSPAYAALNKLMEKIL